MDLRNEHNVDWTDKFKSSKLYSAEDEMLGKFRKKYARQIRAIEREMGGW